MEEDCEDSTYNASNGPSNGTCNSENKSPEDDNNLDINRMNGLLDDNEDDSSESVRSKKELSEVENKNDDDENENKLDDKVQDVAGQLIGQGHGSDEEGKTVDRGLDYVHDEIDGQTKDSNTEKEETKDEDEVSDKQKESGDENKETKEEDKDSNEKTDSESEKEEDKDNNEKTDSDREKKETNAEEIDIEKDSDSEKKETKEEDKDSDQQKDSESEKDEDKDNNENKDSDSEKAETKNEDNGNYEQNESDHEKEKSDNSTSDNDEATNQDNESVSSKKSKNSQSNDSVTPPRKSHIKERTSPIPIVPVPQKDSNRNLRLNRSAPIYIRNSEPVDNSTPRKENDFKTFSRKGKIPPFYDRPGVMQYIQRLSLESVMKGDYEAADRYQELNKQFYEKCRESEQKEREQRDLELLKEQEERINNELNECKDKWKDIIKEAQKDEDAKMDELKKKQEQELAEYDKKWEEDTTLRPYTKPSPNIIQIRTKEKKMILAKMFQDADYQRKWAEECEKDEKIKMQELAEKEAIMGRVHLMQKHQIDQEHLNIKSQQRIANLEMQRDKEIGIIGIKASKIENSRSSAGKINKWIEAENTVKMRSRETESNGLLSPRSQMKMDQYRKTSTASRLVLKPVTKFPKVNVKTLRPSSRSSSSSQNDKKLNA